MAMIVSVQMAAALALHDYLQAQFNDNTIGFSTQWPATDKALFTTPITRRVTILLAGPRKETFVEPYMVGVAVPGAFPNQIYTYAVGMVEQPLQLDVWAGFDADRDDIMARLDQALHQGVLVTLGVLPAGAVSADPFRDGVLLPLANGWTGTTDCVFDSMQVFDTPDAAQQNEFRGTGRGYAEMMLTMQATSARLAAIKFKQRLAEGAIPTTGLYDLQLTASDATSPPTITKQANVP